LSPAFPVFGTADERTLAQMQRCLDAARPGLGVELRGGGADEAPPAYKRLSDVLAAHAGTVRVLHTLQPIGVAMAGPEVEDPFKD